MKQAIPDYQGVTIVILFTIGSSLVFGLAKAAGNDLWLSFLLGLLFALPVIMVYARLRSLLSSHNLYLGLEQVYGKSLGRVITFTFGFYAWRIGVFESKDIAVFVDSVGLNLTPQTVFVLSLSILVLWACKLGIQAMGRWSAFVVKLVVVVILINLILLGTEVDPQEFLPILYEGWKPVVSGALQILDYPFLEIIILFWVFDNLEDGKSPYPIFLLGFTSAAFLLLLLGTATVAVIGEAKYAISYYPTFIAVSRISLFRFITRLEATVGAAFVATTFFKVSICILAAAKCLAHTLGIEDYRAVVTPLALSLVGASQWLGQTQMEVYSSITRVVAPFDLLIQVILPLLLWISAEIIIGLRGQTKRG